MLVFERIVFELATDVAEKWVADIADDEADHAAAAARQALGQGVRYIADRGGGSTDPL
ncbi:hypothetical protein D3C87_2075900 [compost metagenome]